jgi:hypothetical protein
MVCRQCGGDMIWSHNIDLRDDSGALWLAAWHCGWCGRWNDQESGYAALPSQRSIHRPAYTDEAVMAEVERLLMGSFSKPLAPVPSIVYTAPRD